MRGSGHITRGAKTATITVCTDSHLVSLTRDTSTSTYRVTDLATGRDDVYTKLTGTVPEAVTAALGLQPAPPAGTSINIAAQFDPPFLLGDTGAAVARTLGELTQVHTLLEAVRLAHRRRHALAATLRAREADLADAHQRAIAYRGLPARITACDEAEQLATTATALQQRVTRLRDIVARLQHAQALLSQPQPPRPPDTTTVRALADRVHRLTSLVRATADAAGRVHRLDQTVAAHAATTAALRGELTDTLAATPTCPTCGQTITNT